MIKFIPLRRSEKGECGFILNGILYLIRSIFVYIFELDLDNLFISYLTQFHDYLVIETNNGNSCQIHSNLEKMMSCYGPIRDNYKPTNEKTPQICYQKYG